MTLQPGDKLMSLTDVSEMLDIAVHTLYRWRCKGPQGIKPRAQPIRPGRNLEHLGRSGRALLAAM
jgi:hypothetical protein